MFRRTLLAPVAALAIATGAATVGVVAAPVVAVSAEGPAAVASARPVADNPVYCGPGRVLVGGHCEAKRRAKIVPHSVRSGWVAAGFGVAAIGGNLLVGAITG